MAGRTGEYAFPGGAERGVMGNAVLVGHRAGIPGVE